MSRVTVNIADDLLEAAKKALGTETRSETIRTALRESVRHHRRREALAHRGRVDIRLDQEQLQSLRAEG